MVEEILACIEDKNIKYLESGQISKYIFPASRKDAHENKISHLIIRFFILAIKPDGQVLYLVQKRGIKKKSYPEHFTDSASGHVIFKKDLTLRDVKENAIRELEEEFGIQRKAIKSIIFYDLNTEEDDSTKEVAYIFFGLINEDVELNPDPNELEVNGSRFYTKIELENLLEKEKSVDYSKKIWKKLLNVDVRALFKKESDFVQEKEKEIALFIGRFQPLTHGHVYVIKKILDLYNQIKIGIGSSQLSNTKNDPFTSEERQQFIVAALKKRNISPVRYKIYDIPDIFNAAKWVDHVASIVGDFEVVFSNDDWVRELFQNKGFKVGKKITIFKKKYNATNVRNLIYEEDKTWLNLVPKEVVNLINQHNGIDRIKALYGKEN